MINSCWSLACSSWFCSTLICRLISSALICCCSSLACCSRYWPVMLGGYIMVLAETVWLPAPPGSCNPTGVPIVGAVASSQTGAHVVTEEICGPNTASALNEVAVFWY